MKKRVVSVTTKTQTNVLGQNNILGKRGRQIFIGLSKSSEQRTERIIFRYWKNMTYKLDPFYQKFLFKVFLCFMTRDPAVSAL